LDEAVALDGYYLSDDRDFQKHWAFPTGTMIPANGYLIVWADRDLDEAGLHTDFKLAKSSGELFLVYENFMVLDSMTYTAQETNVGLARVPNGTGEFVQQTATFNAENEPVGIGEEYSSPFEWEVFPNPNAGEFKVTIAEVVAADVEGLALLDVYGRTVAYQKGLVFSIASYPVGLYWLRLDLDNGKSYFKKIMIQ